MADERATRARSARRAVGAAVVAIVWLLAVAGAVLAASPHRLEGPITDDVGALTGSNAAMESSIEELQTSTGAQLWIWFTDTLGGADSSSFASETAQASDLGTTDLLLVVALDDRAYGWWKGDDVDLSDSELAGILSRDLEAGLRAETYGTAVRNTAAAIQNAILAPDPVDRRLIEKMLEAAQSRGLLSDPADIDEALAVDHTARSLARDMLRNNAVKAS